MRDETHLDIDVTEGGMGTVLFVRKKSPVIATPDKTEGVAAVHDPRRTVGAFAIDIPVAVIAKFLLELRQELLGIG